MSTHYRFRALTEYWIFFYRFAQAAQAQFSHPGE